MHGAAAQQQPQREEVVVGGEIPSFTHYGTTGPPGRRVGGGEVLTGNNKTNITLFSATLLAALTFPQPH